MLDAHSDLAELLQKISHTFGRYGRWQLRPSLAAGQKLCQYRHVFSIAGKQRVLVGYINHPQGGAS